VNPYVKAISYAKVKTGSTRACSLELLRVGLIPEAHRIGAEHRETRDLLRSRCSRSRARCAAARAVAAAGEPGESN
jgi:hypothetical protein